MADEILEYQIKVRADAAGAKETATALGKVGEAGKKTGEEVAAGAGKATSANRQLKEAVKGLGFESPLLGQIARLALNPIAASVALASSAFALWKWRVEDLTNVLAGMKLPDNFAPMLGRVKAMMQAYEEYAEALKKTLEAYNSVEAAAGRAQKQMDAQASREKKLLASQKELALAKLESERPGMAAGEYERKKRQIEDQFEQAEMRLEQQSRQRKINRRSQEADELEADAKRKKAGVTSWFRVTYWGIAA